MIVKNRAMKMYKKICKNCGIEILVAYKETELCRECMEQENVVYGIWKEKNNI